MVGFRTGTFVVQKNKHKCCGFAERFCRLIFVKKHMVRKSCVKFNAICICIYCEFHYIIDCWYIIYNILFKILIDTFQLYNLVYFHILHFYPFAFLSYSYIFILFNNYLIFFLLSLFHLRWCLNDIHVTDIHLNLF